MEDDFDMEALKLQEEAYQTYQLKEAERHRSRTPEGEPGSLASVERLDMPAHGCAKAVTPLKRKRPFIYKDLAWMQCLYACTASAVALRLADLLWYYREVRQEVEVKVTPPRCRLFHLDRKQRLRGLKTLEANSLVAVQWSNTKSPRVTLILPPHDEVSPGGEVCSTTPTQ